MKKIAVSSYYNAMNDIKGAKIRNIFVTFHSETKKYVTFKKKLKRVFTNMKIQIIIPSSQIGIRRRTK